MCKPGVDAVEGGTVDVVSTDGVDVITVHKKSHNFSKQMFRKAIFNNSQ